MMEGDPDDVEEEEDDWLDTRWAEPDNKCLSGDHGKKKTMDTLGRSQYPLQKKENIERKLSLAQGASRTEDGLMTRMQLNDNKAGMEGLDKEKINQIIYEASKGSKFFENEKKREEQVQRRIDEQQIKLEKITDVQLKQGLEEADKLLQELEESRDLTHTIVHIDMDAFYAAVETRDNPSLRDKPMAVGGNHMLSTSNYLARKYGVRAAMPGFIGKKLCPNLVMVKPNFKQYTAVSQQVRQILAQYDPNFSPMSLDEAYLDFTEHLKKREHLTDKERSYLLRSCDPWETTLCLCDLNEVFRNVFGGKEEKPTTASSDNRSEVDRKTNDEGKADLSCETPGDWNRIMETVGQYGVGAVCEVCGKPFPPHTVEVFGKTVEDAVREMRNRIQQRTRLTASAGIAPNTMLAKVCSDRNKPNGQYRILPDRQEVMDFIKDLPIRKISGIGKVSETMLRALGVVKCQDLYEKRNLLYHLYSSTSFYHFMCICLAIGSTTVERDGERKSMSTERTFSELSRPSDLYKKCSDLCAALVEDLTEKELQGKTVGIKIKTVKFEVKTRVHTLPNYTAEYDDIFTAARELLRVEILAVQPQPLRLRLMGVRMSSLLHQSQCETKRQDTITILFKKMVARSPQKTQTSAHSQIEHQETNFPKLPSLEHPETILPQLPSLDDKGWFPKDIPKELPATDAEFMLDDHQNINCVPEERARNTNTAKTEKNIGKIETGTKSVKMLFKQRTADIVKLDPDVKEINNNNELLSENCYSKSVKTKQELGKKNSTPKATLVKEKRKPGRKKTKTSVSNGNCKETVSSGKWKEAASISMPVDGSGESSGYESSRQAENRRQATGLQCNRPNTIDIPECTSAGSGQNSNDVSTASATNGTEVSPTGSHDTTEVQKLKVFRCPVCQKEVECKNLNYFNDHVDVCLFRQISSQSQSEEELSEAVVDADTRLDGQDQNKQDVSQCLKQETNDTNKEQSNHNMKKHLSPKLKKEKGSSKLNKRHVTDTKCENVQNSKSSLTDNTKEQDSVLPLPGPSQNPSDLPNRSLEDVEFYVCPICNVEKIGCSLQEFNEHVDSCLSRRAIKQILDEQKKLSPGSNKRPPSSSPSRPPPAKKKKRESGGKMKTIDSFFK